MRESLSFFLIVSCLTPFGTALSRFALRQQDMVSASNKRNLCHLRALSALLDGLNPSTSSGRALLNFAIRAADSFGRARIICAVKNRRNSA